MEVMGEEKKLKRKGIHAWWLALSLKQKIWMFAGAVVLTISLAALINVFVVNFSLYGIGLILDQNARSYAFQEAMEEESEAFEIYMRKKSEENKDSYLAACAQTQHCLEALPFDYAEIGATRYARTWSIRNAYESYSQIREQVAGLDERDAGYVTSLYRVYKIQGYMGTYARRLVQLTLQEGSQEYLVKVPFLHQLPYWLLAFDLLLILVILYLTQMMRTAILSPVERLAQASRRIARNDFPGEDIAVENQDEMGELVRAFNKMKHATVGYITTLEEKHEMSELLHKEELERVEMEKILEATRLEVLKSQINPHFLFNTLNMISCMARLEEAETTDKMINSMGNLFRYNLKTSETEVPLWQELKIVDDYMYIQQMRFGSRIQYKKSIRVDEHQVIIPSFSLQPIVENAIIHGLSKKEKGGMLHIRVWRRDNVMVISVADSGIGMDKVQLAKLRAACAQRKTVGVGIGLGNIYKRLHMMYEGADLKIFSKEGMGTVVQMRIPQLSNKYG